MHSQVQLIMRRRDAQRAFEKTVKMKLAQTALSCELIKIQIPLILTQLEDAPMVAKEIEMQSVEKYLEEFEVGQKFGSGRLRVEKERIKTFAAEFDPQPFHLDDDAARNTMFRGLAASGWHTAAITMKLLVESDLKPAGGIVGAGLDELRWPLVVRPGDELRVESEILNVRTSKSHPERGFIKVRTTTFNQLDEPVQVAVVNLVVPRRVN